MKKVLIIIISLLLIAGGVLFYIYFVKEENVNLEYEVDVFSDVSLSNYSSDIDCKFEDEVIDTKKVGELTVTKNCRNKKYLKYKYEIKFNVVDKVEPFIILKDSYSVEEGYSKKLEDVIISVDNYDSTPKREIIGDYDFNKVGDYNLKYKITDSSGNSSEKDFVLHVNKKSTKKNTSTSFIAYSDIVKDYKKDNTRIGIDVSKWQGDIDFDKIKNAGVEFIIMRIGYQDGFNGDYIIDPYFQNNIKKAKEHNIDVGLYFYSYANSRDEAIKQADWIVKTLGDYKLELPISFDWETWSSFNSLNMSLYEFNDMTNAFLERIESLGFKSMLYSSKNYLENIYDATNKNIWLAHYTYNTNYSGDYILWQMCSDGKLSGINGYVDIDILYK